MDLTLAGSASSGGTLGWRAFYYSTYMTSAHLNNIASVDMECFSTSTRLDNITFDYTNQSYGNSLTFGKNAFQKCSKLKQINIHVYAPSGGSATLSFGNLMLNACSTMQRIIIKVSGSGSLNFTCDSNIWGDATHWCTVYVSSSYLNTVQTAAGSLFDSYRQLENTPWDPFS